MNKPEVKTVPFMGDELIAYRDNNGQVWAGIRWMCDGLGMTEGQRKRQIRNIQDDRVLSKGGSNLVLPTRSGNQDVFCLKLDYVPLWLAKIKITPTMEAETPALADKLEAYQLKAKDALANAFNGGADLPETTYEKPTMAEVRYMELQARTMERMNCTPFEVAGMIARTGKAYGLMVSPELASKVDPQLSLFSTTSPALPA